MRKLNHIFNGILFAVILMFFSLNVNGQRQKKKFPVWIGPSKNVEVYGLNLMPIAFKLPKNTVVNGINLEVIGAGMVLGVMPFDPIDRFDSLTVWNDFTVNGLTAAPLGIMQLGKVNGIAVTPGYIYIHKVNGVDIGGSGSIVYYQKGVGIGLGNSAIEATGIQLGLIGNKTRRLKGVQIGLVNRTKQLKGLQIGLWNINEKRKQPLINW